MLQVDRVDSAKGLAAREVIRGLGSVLIAYSGGVDSTLLLKLALEELPGRAVAVLASSPAYPAAEQAAARNLAQELGAPLLEVETREVELEAYLRNQPDRCFHCKEELFETLEPIQRSLGLMHLAYGANADDLSDHRPGHVSAARRGVRFPLLEAGLGKAEIRALAREAGLPNWNKASFACLSSRIPYGTRVTQSALRQVEVAESVLRDAGFSQLRVRHHGAHASVEVGVDEVPRLQRLWAELEPQLREAGFASAAIDPDGYATGKLSPRRRAGR